MNRALAVTLCCLITAAWGCFALFYFGVKFAPVKSYYKFLKHYHNGVSETYKGEFLRFEDEPLTKDGLAFYSLICAEKVIKRPDHPERRILIEIDLPKPDFAEGQAIKYITHAGILVAYDNS